MAWVLSNSSDVLHNVGVVSKIKKLIGCRQDAELKYKSLRRHRSRKAALDVLSEVRAQVIIVPIIKGKIRDPELKDPKTKRLINLMHEFPLGGLLEHLGEAHPGSYFQLMFDEVGWKGCEETIRESFRADNRLDWESARRDWLMFGKSGGNSMLQLADVFAGLGHEYVEDLQHRELPPCRVCYVGRKPKNNRDCSYRRRKMEVGKAGLMRILYPLLLKDADGDAWERGFVIRPLQLKGDYLFIDCLLEGK